MEIELTTDLIVDLANGCTVYSRQSAKLIRELQQEHPTWVDVIDDMKKLQDILGTEIDGAGVTPYFGAILTEEGKKNLCE